MNAPAPAPLPELTEETRKRIFLEEQIKKLHTPIFSKKNVVMFGVMILLVFAMAVYMFLDKIEQHLIYLLWIFLILVVYVALIIFLMVPLRSFVRGRLERELSTVRSEELQEKLDENFFTNLVKINFKYIDKYYLQTQVQANKSFLLTAIAACISFAIIIAGILMLYLDPDKAQPGYVATASGILGEFIAAVFFYLYNKTITKMGEYHEKLVLTQNIGLALRITEDLPQPEKTAAQVKFIECLCQDINLYLTGHGPNAPRYTQLDSKPISRSVLMV